MSEKKETKEVSAFDTLYAVDCREHSEKKNGLTYLSWAWAWAEVKKAFPSAKYTVYENGDGWNYFTDGRTCWVKTGVTINELEHIEYLPVMDFKNKSIPADIVTSYDVNKAIQRSLTKACARHGLGLYIYAGEDLPEEMGIDVKAQDKKPAPAIAHPVKAQPKPKKGLEVWKKFCEHASSADPELDVQTIKKMFAKLVADQTGKSKSSDLTDEDWEKVEQAFAA